MPRWQEGYSIEAKTGATQVAGVDHLWLVGYLRAPLPEDGVAFVSYVQGRQLEGDEAIESAFEQLLFERPEAFGEALP